MLSSKEIKLSNVIFLSQSADKHFNPEILSNHTTIQKFKNVDVNKFVERIRLEYHNMSYDSVNHEQYFFFAIQNLIPHVTI